MREEVQSSLLTVTKGTSGSTRPGGRMKTTPQGTEEKEARERKVIGWGGGGEG